MKTRRYSLLTLALLLMVSVLNVRAQAPDAFYIYKNDGTTMPFFNDLVDSYLTAVYGTTDQFKNEKMYAIDFEIMPFAAGPAGCS